MTYFGAAENSAHSVESKMATHNFCQSLHNVPCGTLGKFAKIDEVEKRSTWNIMIVEISVEISLALLVI
jgi:hypothetical protein